MNSKINFNENNMICNTKDAEEMHNLIMKLIKETEAEMLFSSNIFSTCKRRFLKDLAFNLHEIRRDLEIGTKRRLENSI